MKHKIGYFLAEDWERAYVKKHFSKDELEIYADPLTLEGLRKYSEVLDNNILCVFVQSKLDSKVLSRFPALKFIATRSTGFDHIDLDECKRRRIVISNVPAYGQNTVAEHAFALLLCISRKIIDSVVQTKKKDFSHGDELRGFDLKGKIFGVIGTGNIGKHAIEMAKGFGMDVIAYDPFPDKKAARKLKFIYKRKLEDVLKMSDILTLHAPYIQSTHHILNKYNMRKIKKGAVLINTARGGLVETEALIETLESGRLSFVGLDVLEGEGLVKKKHRGAYQEYSKEERKTVRAIHKLLKMPNVIITPHNAFNTHEAIRRIVDTTIENIMAFEKGRPQNLVSS